MEVQKLGHHVILYQSLLLSTIALNDASVLLEVHPLSEVDKILTQLTKAAM